MKKRRFGTILVYALCAALTICAFFAKDFVFYDFQMLPSDYAYLESNEDQPVQAATPFWFSHGENGRELYYGHTDEVSPDDIQLYTIGHDGVLPISQADMQPIHPDFHGYFIAALPVRELDLDGDGRLEIVHDYARADISVHTYELAPRAFDTPELPFQLAFEERKVIQVFYQNEPLVDGEVTVLSADGAERIYTTDSHGWIQGLPIGVIRSGFTVSYSPDGQNLYRMYYTLEDYPYFTPHFFEAHFPLLLMLLLSAAGIVIVYFIRNRYQKRDPAHAIYSRERPGLRGGNHLGTRTNSKFLFIRWLFLIFGFFFWTYAGKLMAQGQALNQVAIPVFSCPFNLDQALESSCYYLTHLPVLFTRHWGYVVWFLVTVILCIVVFGRILCGFMCPLGFVQDLFDRLRAALHIRPITVTDRMNKIIQPLKWTWIILFLGFVFVGGDFCDICPNKVFSPALGGWWVNYTLGGFLTIPLLVGSFYIKRFWCLMCPMGYLLGIFHKFNIFKLKKGCTACTECGACYEACPMRLKNIYTERESEDVQTVDCLMCGECIDKCPEDNALSMTLCGKPIYKSSRSTFLSRYAHLEAYGEEQKRKEKTEV